MKRNKFLKYLLCIVLSLTVLLSLVIVPSSAADENTEAVASDSSSVSISGLWVLNSTIDLSYFGDITNLAYVASSANYSDLRFSVKSDSTTTEFSGIRPYSGQNYSTDSIVYNSNGWTNDIYRCLYFDNVSVSSDFYSWLNNNGYFCPSGEFTLPLLIYLNKECDLTYFSNPYMFNYAFGYTNEFPFFSDGQYYTSITSDDNVIQAGCYDLNVYDEGFYNYNHRFIYPVGNPVVERSCFLALYDNSTFYSTISFTLDGTYYFNEYIEWESYYQDYSSILSYYFGNPLYDSAVFHSSGSIFTGLGPYQNSLGSIAVNVYSLGQWHDESFRYITFDNVTVSPELYFRITENATKVEENPYQSFYDRGYSDGYLAGLNDSISYDNGYDDGYSEGYSDGVNYSDSEDVFDGFLSDIINLPIEGFDNIYIYHGTDLFDKSFSISIWDVLCTCLAFTLCFFVIKRIIS